MSEHSIGTTLMRGGTSKGVFVQAADLPPAGPERDRFVLALLGSPDPMQIDGLGGTHSSTSKLMAVSRSEEPGCDVDYLFAQVAIDEPVVDYQGNCGNLTTAIGPFAIDEGLVPLPADQGAVTVILRNLNTGVRVRACVPLCGGRAATEGDHAVAGVPGSGAPITTDFLEPGGSVLGSALPTGNPVDRIELADGLSIEASIVDVTSPHAFVRADDVDLDDLDRLEAIRRACGAAVGLDSPAIPRLAVVAPPADGDGGADLQGRATSMQRLHHAFPLTGALCTAAAVRMAGTIPAEAARSPRAQLSDAGRGRAEVARVPDGEGCAVEGPVTVRLRHPKGVIELRADVAPDGRAVRAVGVTRTARRLLRGEAYVVLP